MWRIVAGKAGLFAVELVFGIALITTVGPHMPYGGSVHPLEMAPEALTYVLLGLGFVWTWPVIDWLRGARPAASGP